ncbi:enoyl-CoA hydratase/isomerase family protein [Bradyrhizobium sp. dw_411]|uniref:enoyl-CoA hydratase/isomerase family protein n=1 Tax=Bradyrhizobium sp. dw_411 TaxID=2720082 RepID=UPI001BCC50B8|nr:enoyl-CoA hydratase/isomerase family protein [Bradyrhizobium sp. dw_411]
MTAAPLLVDIEGNVAVVTLNRPDRLNAFNQAMREALIAELGRLNRDDAIRAIVITGTGPRAFSAGQDLDEAGSLDWTQIAARHHVHQATYQAVRDLDKPCIAAINGLAAGQGFQVSLCTDWRIAAPDVRMGQPEVKVGLGSIVGSFFMSMYVGMTHNAQMSLSGDLITGQRAYEIGLLTELTPAGEDTLAVSLQRAKQLAALPPTAIRMTKERFRALTQPGFEEACIFGIRSQLECYAKGEPQETMQAFLQKRRDRQAARMEDKDGGTSR